MKNKKIYSVVIVDEQDYWENRSDYICSATSLDKAKELLMNWLMFNDYLEDDEKFDSDLASSIEIWENELNELSDAKRISVNLNELTNK